MSLRSMREELIRAEMEFAHFNAKRTAPVDDHSGIRWESTEHFELLHDPTRPASTYFNRAVGRSPEALPAAALSDLPPTIAGVELTPEQLTSESAEALLGSRFRPSYQLCYLGTTPDARLPVEEDVVRLDPSQVDFFFDLLELSGVPFPPARRAAKRSYYGTDQFQAYVAKAPDGTARAWSTMFVAGPTAFFGNSFTLPQFRLLGAHGALLAARLNAAADLGIATAYTDVEHGSRSHYNCQRVGFRPLTVNTIWSRHV